MICFVNVLFIIRPNDEKAQRHCVQMRSKSHAPLFRLDHKALYRNGTQLDPKMEPVIYSRWRAVFDFF